MQTDIRMMIEGLRPVEEFRSKVEATIGVLNTQIEDMIPVDNEDQQELDAMKELVEFWATLLDGMERK